MCIRDSYSCSCNYELLMLRNLPYREAPIRRARACSAQRAHSHTRMPTRPGKRPRGAFDALIASPLYEPEAMDMHLSIEAMALVSRALARLEGPVVDYHCHVAGRGRGSACCVHPSMRDDASILNAAGYVNRAKMRVFMCAFGAGEDDTDAAVAQRLARLARHTPHGLHLSLIHI